MGRPINIYLSDESYQLLKKVENKSGLIDSLVFKHLNPKRFDNVPVEKLDKLIELENKRQELVKQLNEVNNALSE